MDNSGSVRRDSVVGTRQCGAMGVSGLPASSCSAWVYTVLSAVDGGVCSIRMRTGNPAAACVFPEPQRAAGESPVPVCISAYSGMVPPVLFGSAYISECTAACRGNSSAWFSGNPGFFGRASSNTSIFYILSVRDLFPMCNNFVHVVKLVKKIWRDILTFVLVSCIIIVVL